MATISAMKRPTLNAAIAITTLAFVLLLPVIVKSPLSVINVGLMFALAWYGWANTPDTDEGNAAAPRPHATKAVLAPAERSTVSSDPFDAIDRDIARASRLADADDAVTALHRFRRTLKTLSDQDFDDHISNELNVIVERNFPDLISRYVAARQRASGVEGDEADKILAASVRRLGISLEEIASRQARIRQDRLREHGDYLRERHPVDEDPFSTIGSAQR